MRLDGGYDFHEEETPFSYRPQGMGLQYSRGHSALYYSYHADDREDRLDMLARREPELAVAVECAKVMGLFDDCAELNMLRAFRDSGSEEEIGYYRENAPRIASVLRKRRERLKELYFTWILPMVAAIDASETEIAGRICRTGMVLLANETYGQS